MAVLKSSLRLRGLESTCDSEYTMSPTTLSTIILWELVLHLHAALELIDQDLLCLHFSVFQSCLALKTPRTEALLSTYLASGTLSLKFFLPIEYV
jgi:hypothetical protein